jgi:hypothetical protein
VSLRNAIEHIFSVLKKCFRILRIGPECNLEIQAQIPAALCAIHNFIQEHNPDELEGEIGEPEGRDAFDDLESEDGLPAPENEAATN